MTTLMPAPMSVPNPAPAPAPVDLIVSQPSTPVSINTTNFVPVTKYVTLGLFIVALVGFLFIGVFILYNFLRRRRLMRAGLLPVTAPVPNMSAVAPRPIPPMYDGFVVANPCGEEQVAYKLDDSQKGIELKKISIEKSDPETHSCSGASCCGSESNTQGNRTSPDPSR